MRPMSKATTTRKVDYFRLPRPLWRKLNKCLPKKKRKKVSRDGRPSASDRAVINGIWYVLWTGCQWKAVHRDWFGVSSSVIHERFQRWRRMGLFEKLMKWMAEYYARERGGISWKWQAMDSKNSPAPRGGQKTGKNPTDRGKRGAKMNLLVDQSGAPLSVVLTGANCHDKVSAVELIVSIALKRPAHKEQHLCADQAYDASDVREFASSGGYTTHIKINPRKRPPNRAANPRSERTLMGSLIRRGDGWWSGRFPGSPSVAACALAGPRRPKTGWPSFSLPAPTSSSIWRFSDRV